MKKSQITIAINKGRILQEALPLLARSGIVPCRDPLTSRQLILSTNIADIRMTVMRGMDVPVHVGHGSVELGIVGKDVLLEIDDTSFYEPLDLGISKCRLVRAAPPGKEIGTGCHGRVGTKFVNTARQYYPAKGIRAEIIKLHGSVEITPALNLADEIVDLVQTGKTLESNGLVVIDTLSEISARVIVNKEAMKCRFAQLTELLSQLRTGMTNTTDENPH